MSFHVQQIDHVEVFVRDIDQSIQWYAEILGLKEVYRWQPEPVMIGIGGTMLALFQDSAGISTPASRERKGWYLVAWRTDTAGFDAARRHLTEHGVAYRGPVDHGIAQSIYFADPDGNLLEITRYEPVIPVPTP